MPDNIVSLQHTRPPTKAFRKAGIATIIRAYHLGRASISAAREAAKAVLLAQLLMDVENRLASMRETFKLTGNDELEEASQRHLPVSRNVRGVVLAASRGSA